MIVSRFDIIPTFVGIGTTGVGAGVFATSGKESYAEAGFWTLQNTQSMLGIAVAIAGLVLTIATFIWRRREHKRRMEQPSGKIDMDHWDGPGPI